MKEPLKAPFIYVLVLLCAAAVLAGLQVLAVWGIADPPAGTFSVAYAVRNLPRAVFDVAIPAVALSIVLMGFRMARRPFSRLLGLLVVLVIGYAALVNGMIWSRTLAARTRPVVEAPRQYLGPGTLTRVGGTFVAVNDVTGAALRGILVADPSRAANRLAVYPAGTVLSRAGSLTITTASRPPLTIAGGVDLSWTALFAPDRFTALFLRDIDTLTVDFEALMAGSLPEFFAASFAFVFLCSASLVLLRLTRWRLANAILLVIAVRGIFSLYHLFAVQVAPQVGRVVTDPAAARLFPAAAFAVLGVVLLLVDILFIPAARWSSPEAA